MQISKTLLTFGTAALCLAAVSSRAVDTEADLKLREALRQKMAEVAPETAAPVAAPTPAPSKPAKVKAPKKSAPVAPVVAAPVVAVPMVEAPVVEPAPVASPTVAEPVAPVVAATEMVQPAPVAMDASQTERLREAVRARMEQEAATPTQPQQVVTQGSDLEPTISTTRIVAPTVTAVPMEPTAAAPVVSAPVKAPVTFEAPALPISGSKEQRLAALLQQYKADQISPQEYHEQRAKIIAE